jgi:hypothetical protein
MVVGRLVLCGSFACLLQTWISTFIPLEWNDRLEAVSINTSVHISDLSCTVISGYQELLASQNHKKHEDSWLGGISARLTSVLRYFSTAEFEHVPQ